MPIKVCTSKPTSPHLRVKDIPPGDVYSTLTGGKECFRLKLKDGGAVILTTVHSPNTGRVLHDISDLSVHKHYPNATINLNGDCS